MRSPYTDASSAKDIAIAKFPTMLTISPYTIATGPPLYSPARSPAPVVSHEARSVAEKARDARKLKYLCVC